MRLITSPTAGLFVQREVEPLSLISLLRSTGHEENLQSGPPTFHSAAWLNGMLCHCLGKS